MRRTRACPHLALNAFAAWMLVAVAWPDPGNAGIVPRSWHPADATTAEHATRWMNRLSSGWSPNLGQIADAEGHVATNVLYAASIPGAHVYVTTSGISHYFLKRSGGREREEGREALEGYEDETREYEWARLDVHLAGARIRADAARIENTIAVHGATNYYLPHCPNGVTNVPTYGQVTFAEVYRGIDWVIRNEPGEGVHHDFVVHPGADATQIALEYAGATSIELSDDSRTLIVRTALGKLREGALHCFQGDPSHPIDARFRVAGNKVSVVVAAYDRSKPLVIDPPLVWSTYYGGSGYDGPRTIYCDNANDAIYIVGYGASPNMPVQDPGGGSHFQGMFGGFQDGFIWKFSQAGVRQWATYYGGTWDEINADCVVDASGSLYVCGTTGSANLPTQTLAGAYNQTTSGGMRDGYVLKFDATGVRQWATYYGGDGDDYANGIATDPDGKVYVCGTTSSTDLVVADPGSGVYFDDTLGGVADAYLLRFGPAGALEWASYYGGDPGEDNGYGITIAAGSLYMMGTSHSAAFPTLNPGGGAFFQPANAGDEDYTISRFTPAGVQTWATYFGGGSTEVGNEPVVDANGNLYVCGVTHSTDMPTFNPGGSAFYQGTKAGQLDLFVAKFGPANEPIWATYFGGTDNDYFNGPTGKPITVDAQGRVYLTALTFSSDLPSRDPGGDEYFHGPYAGSADACLVRFRDDGKLTWSTFFGTEMTDFGSSVALGREGCLFMTGESVGNGDLETVDPGAGAWEQTANAGSDDGFIAKFCNDSSNVDVPVLIESERSVRLVTKPNPFAGSSTIEFALPHAEDVELGIYDLSGRLVRSLWRGRLGTGPQRFAWNGRDERGRQTGAGVYLVRLSGSRRHPEAKLVRVP